MSRPSITSERQFLQHFFDGQLVVGGDRLEHTAEQGADFQRLVIWHRDMMRAVQGRGEAEMRTILPAEFVAEGTESLRQFST